MQSNNSNKENAGSQSSIPASEKDKIPKSQKNKKASEKKESSFSFEALKGHKNPVVRFFVKVVYSVWLAVMGIGIFFAWLISVLLL